MIDIQGIPEVAARLAAARKAESLAKRKKRGQAAAIRGRKQPVGARSASGAKTRAA
jgi:hypothetical protein